MRKLDKKEIYKKIVLRNKEALLKVLLSLSLPDETYENMLERLRNSKYYSFCEIAKFNKLWYNKCIAKNGQKVTDSIYRLTLFTLAKYFLSFNNIENISLSKGRNSKHKLFEYYPAFGETTEDVQKKSLAIRIQFIESIMENIK